MAEEKYSWRNLYMVWAILGLIYAGVALFVVKTGVGYSDALVYAFSAFIVAELLLLVDKEKKNPPNVFAMFLGAIFACFPVIVAVSSFNATAAIWLEVVGIILVWLLNSQQEFGTREEQASMLAVIPMGVWTFWAFVFLYDHLSGSASGLTWQIGIYYLGILLFAGFSILRFVGIVDDNEESQRWTMYLLALAVIGMLLITNLGVTLNQAAIWLLRI